ncbi:MAG: hypothetical protein O7B99_03485 [Planctomycetota bacterium]|nr:hypothetical protein [Planctomycetota bacterium]
MPRPDVAPLLQESFVALASDCDAPEPEVERLAMNLEGAMMLPFLLLADAEGNYLDGTSGAISPEGLRMLLEKAIA